ncbi:MAG: hypothetical protein GX442_06270 [Candidatus Riflebacteria bacterium]|nr:hypothetical protein [Candidatus Riflebacteria bacterium]
MNARPFPGRPPRHSRVAATLVEVIMSVLIFSILLGIGYTFLSRTFTSMERQRQSLDTMHESRNFLMLIERDLREMTRLVSLDTIFKDHLFVEENALFYSMELEVPLRKGDGYTTVTYTYEGPTGYQDSPTREKIIYRQEKGGVKKALITKQMNYLKIWGTDGTIFRNRGVNESLADYRTYLGPHYYHPSNPFPNGLNDLAKVRGIEVQLCMHEMFDAAGKPIKDRTFVTRIYSRVLNAKYE